MKIINNTSKPIICLIHQAKKKAIVEPFSNKTFPFYKGEYLIATLIKNKDVEFHDIWETLNIDEDGEIIVGYSKTGNSGSITHVTSAEISTIFFKNNGKTTLEICLENSQKPLCVLKPLGECWSWGMNAEGFRIGQTIRIKDSDKIVDKIILDSEWVTRIDLGLIAFRKA